MYKLARVFYAYSLSNLILAVLDRWLTQHRVDGMQFFSM